MTEQIQPSISVVIPCFNVSESILIEAVRSACSQEINLFEILIVDDGSADPRVAQAVASSFEHVRVIRHQANRGGSAARNTGIDEARGDLIALLDADDTWLPGKLKAQVEALLAFADGAISPLSFCACNCFLERGAVRRPANHVAPDKNRPIWRYFLEDDCALQTSTMLLPAALAKAVRFDPALPRHQDWDFAIRLQEAGAQIVYLDECLSLYRLHDSPNRISCNPKALRNSLVWFHRMRGKIPAKTMQHFFFTKLLSRKALSAPFSLMLAMAQAIMLSPATALAAMLASRRKSQATALPLAPAGPAVNEAM